MSDPGRGVEGWGGGGGAYVRACLSAVLKNQVYPHFCVGFAFLLEHIFSILVSGRPNFIWFEVHGLTNSLILVMKHNIHYIRLLKFGVFFGHYMLNDDCACFANDPIWTVVEQISCFLYMKKSYKHFYFYIWNFWTLNTAWYSSSFACTFSLRIECFSYWWFLNALLSLRTKTIQNLLQTRTLIVCVCVCVCACVRTCVRGCVRACATEKREIWLWPRCCHFA